MEDSAAWLALKVPENPAQGEGGIPMPTAALGLDGNMEDRAPRLALKAPENPAQGEGGIPMPTAALGQ